jgi:5-formyltetrahydrofolate cyclo-ligase
MQELGANPVLKIGLGREELLYPVPTDETDIRMDMVLTESRLIRP